MGQRMWLADTNGFKQAPFHLSQQLSLSRNLFLFSEPTGFLGSRHKGPSVSARTSRGPHSNIVKSLKIVWHGGLTYGRVHEACQNIKLIRCKGNQGEKWRHRWNRKLWTKKNRHQRTKQKDSSPEQLRTDVFSYEAAQSPLLYNQHISKRNTEGRRIDWRCLCVSCVVGQTSIEDNMKKAVEKQSIALPSVTTIVLFFLTSNTCKLQVFVAGCNTRHTPFQTMQLQQHQAEEREGRKSNQLHKFPSASLPTQWHKCTKQCRRATAQVHTDAHNSVNKLQRRAAPGAFT